MGRRAPLFAALLATLAASPALAADPDPWLGEDKALHFAATAGLAILGYGSTSYFTEDVRIRLAVGGGLALVAGIAKELADLAGAGNPSWKDLTWDVLGTAAGLLVAWGLDFLLCDHAPPQQRVAGTPTLRLAGPLALQLRW
jgi:putative lipoprotein